ncbi:MAG: glycosyltransferase [Paludibacter sp.]|nr:glycosyltransferase [Paludibacter sp.]
MKVLIVCSGNSGRIVPFIVEQVVALQSKGVETDYFLVQQKGILGYLKEKKKLLSKIKSFQPDLIHAHYGLSGLLANLQRQIPVVTTYHGSDINNHKVFLFSKLCMMLSAYNIFVSGKNRKKANLTPGPSPKGEGNCDLIPCGVDIEPFKPIDKLEARIQLKLDKDKKYVLFAGSFTNEVKNPELAKQSVNLIENVELLELKGYSREQVALLMNAVDCVLMTSFTEGSPQFIKEAMACNCPVVSVPVGDVPDVIENIEGCFISTYEPTDVAVRLKLALEFGKRTEGRNRIVESGLDSETVAKKIIGVYEKVINAK